MNKEEIISGMELIMHIALSYANKGGHDDLTIGGLCIQ